MSRLYFYCVVCTVCLIIFVGCDKELRTEQVPSTESAPVSETGNLISTQQPEVSGDSAGAKLTFSLNLDQRVYDVTDYGEPPQFAIWLEDAAGDKIRTVWVTYRMGTGDWIGKTECHVALPYWVSRYNKETGTAGPPKFRTPVADAITGATPPHEFTVQADVPPGSGWKYFIEVNASGDYNAGFPAAKPNGLPDPQANGQPSLIYQGQIEAVDGAHDEPELIGRTDQWHPVDYIITDLQGITSAKNLFSRIEVSCQLKQ